MRVECVVAGSHLRYDGVWQRPQQILSRIAERVPVLFVEEPFAAALDRDELVAHGDLTILRPKRRQPAGRGIDAATLRAVQAWVGDRSPLVWLYTPMMNELAAAFPHVPLVYDCMDELAAFAFAPAGLDERERALLARADLVFAGGRSLYEARRAHGAKVRLFASGVEFEHFARARALAPHPLLVNLSRPIFGYAGAIDERIDMALLEALAERDAQLIMIGPVVKIDPATLPRHPNVHFTGQLPYADLPPLLAGFDVAIMPFARNAATAHISPTKTPEYLAAGRPVVSTGIEDVIADYGDVVTIADGPADFASACFAQVSASDPERIARGVERARAVGWTELVARMWYDIERA